MKIQDINFKQAFIALSVVFVIFTIASVSYEVANGRWEEAVSYEQNRMDAGQDRARHGHRDRQGRLGRRNTNIEREVDDLQVETTNELVPPSRGFNDRVLYRVAKTYVRITSMELTVLNILGMLLHIAFIVLLTLWVYVDSKKHERHPLLWTGLVLFTHLYGWLLYMIVREGKRMIHQRQALPEQ